MQVDATTGKVKLTKTLHGVPGEIHVMKDEIFISFPTLKCIKVYSTDQFTELRTIEFEHEVYAFDFYQDRIIYTAGYHAYCYDTSTGDVQQLTYQFISQTHNTFSHADVLVNPFEDTFYISESGTSGGEIYYFDAKTLAFKWYHSHESYGKSNNVRRTFIDEDYVYWGGLKLTHGLSEKHLYKAFREDSSFPNRMDEAVGILHVSKDYVVTTNGIFQKSDNKVLLTADWHAYREGVCVTESHYLMMTKKFEGTNLMYIFPPK